MPPLKRAAALPTRIEDQTLVRVAVAAAPDEIKSGFGICRIARERIPIDLVVLLVVNEAVANGDRMAEPDR